jgi:enamine deaminase RidA (YjgF/YER057c/UK114 family)
VARTKGGADLNEGEIEAGLPKTANYRYADRVGAQLFVSGQVPHDRSANLVGIDNPAEQASQCLRNLRTLITHHGFKESDIRKLTIYVIGEEQNRNAPPSTLLGVARLGYPHQIVEIDATIVAEAE